MQCDEKYVGNAHLLILCIEQWYVGMYGRRILLIFQCVRNELHPLHEYVHIQLFSTISLTSEKSTLREGQGQEFDSNNIEHLFYFFNNNDQCIQNK